MNTLKYVTLALAVAVATIAPFADAFAPGKLSPSYAMRDSCQLKSAVVEEDVEAIASKIR